MKKSKKTNVLAILIVFLLVLAVAYAAFNQTLTITGTATAQGNWDIHFENESITTKTGNSVTIGKTEGSTVNDKLTVAAKLSHPGDKATVSVDIVNKGSVDAKLTKFTVAGEGFTQSGNVYTNGVIKITVPTIAENEVLTATTGTKTFAFDIEWDSNKTDTTVAQQAEFTITFDYVQAV